MGKKETIDVSNIDSQKAEEIKQALKKASDEGIELIHLNLKSAKGNIPVAIDLITEIHSSKTEVTCNCSGELDLAGVILAAGSKFTERKAQSGAMFQLYEEEKSFSKKRKQMTINEKNAQSILEPISMDKGRKLKNAILNGSKITAREMVYLNLLDKVDEFVDKYADERMKAKEQKKGG